MISKTKKKPKARKMLHSDSEVDRLFRQLCDALCQWERITGRESLLIFREAEGNFIREGRPMPSAVVIRLDNGIPLDERTDDLKDDFLLQRFSDALSKG